MKTNYIICVLLLLITSCSSFTVYKTGVMLDKSVATTGDEINSGAILFREKKDKVEFFFNNLLIKSEKAEENHFASNDILVEGKWFYKSDEVARIDTAQNVIDSLLGVSMRNEQWSGTFSSNGTELPVFFSVYAFGDDDPKEYELITAKCNASRPKSIFEKMLSSNGSEQSGDDVRVGNRLIMNTRISGEIVKSIPFEIARFIAETGTEYKIFITQEFEVNIVTKNMSMEQALAWYKPNDSIRKYVSADGQVFQITDCTGKTAYADCTKTDFTLYEATAGYEEEVKMCIGMFIGFLYAIGV